MPTARQLLAVEAALTKELRDEKPSRKPGAHVPLLLQTSKSADNTRVLTATQTQQRRAKLAGFSQEERVGFVLDSKMQGSVPLLHLRGRDGHFYTTSVEEATTFVEKFGYEFVDVAGFVFEDDVMAPTPLYRLSNGTSHFFTTSDKEVAKAKAAGYKPEGIACYLLSR